MAEKLQILHLEDDPLDAELVGVRLDSEGLPHEIRWAKTQVEFETALAEESFDVILADYSLPGFGGLEALRWANEHRPELPFIFVSGSIGEERAINCLKLGARDYVLKDRTSRLVPVIQRAVEEARVTRERRKVKADLEVANQRQRVLLEATCAAGVVPWALHADELTLGDSACYLLALPAEELPRTLAQLEARVHPDDRGQVRNAFERVMQGSASIFECRIQRGNGGFIWTRWTRHKHPASLGGIFQDVGEQHRLLEQLIQGQKMESLGALAGRVAHDFSNIVQAIVGQSEALVMKGALDPDQRKGLETIHRAGERGMSLIRQLRSFSRDAPVHRIPTHLPSLVGEIQGLLSGTLGPEVELDVQVESDPPQVMADPAQLHQILMNLVVNARDALGSKGGRILLRVGNHHLTETQAALQRRTSGNYALLAVEDDGPGIPEEVLAHIFEPYFTTKGEKGTGLGLSVACGIAEAHGGWLACESEAGRGTRFRIFLPQSSVGDPSQTSHAITGANR